MSSPLYQHIASLLIAVDNCRRSANQDWLGRHMATLRAMDHDLPSGSGFNSGSHLDLDRSTADRLVIHTSYHHMDVHGGYDGWTEHTVTVRPSLAFGISVSVSGRDRDGIKDYIAECMDSALRETVD